MIRALGISAGALYHHFPSKRSLLEGIGERAVNKLTTSMNAWIADDQLSPGAKVDRFLDAMDDGRRLRVMVDYLGLGIVREDRDMHEVVVQLGLEPLTDRLVKFIEQGNACKEFRVSNPKATALIVMLLISESIHRVGRIEQIVPDGKFNASLREAINRLLMRGIT